VTSILLKVVFRSKSIMSNLKFSIITVCFNAAKDLERTLKSVILQSFDSVEHIVIDGDSSDGTLELIDRYKPFISTWISEGDRGIYDAMNKGIKLARGEYLNFLNAGDMYFDRDVLKKAAAQIKDKVDIAYGDCFVKGARRYNGLQEAGLIESLSSKMPFCHQSAFYRREALQENIYDISYKLAADYELALRLYKQGSKFQKIKNFPVCFYEAKGASDTKRSEVVAEYGKARQAHGLDSYRGKFVNFYQSLRATASDTLYKFGQTHEK
jgi:glycosyltransferase involved in cell wall biosynthesis